MKKGKYSTLGKNTLLFAVSSFGTKIITFLLVPLYTSVLSTNDYGTIDLITAAVQLLIPILTLNIQDAVLRFSLDRSYRKEDVLKTSVHITLVGSFILFCGILILQLTGICRLNIYYLAFLFAQYLLNSISNIFQMHLKANEKILVLTIGGIINILTVATLNVLLLLVCKLGVNGYMLANTLGLAIFDIYLLFSGEIYKSIHRGNIRLDLLKVMAIYSTPLIANSLAWWVNNASDRYILTAFCGVSENGVYSVAYKVPTILYTLTGIFYNAWSIAAITYFDKDDKDAFIGNIYSAYSCLAVLSCSFLILVNIPISSLLYSNDFFQAYKYVPFLTVGAVFNSLSLFEGCLFGAIKKTKVLSITTIVGAFVNTVLNFILIYFFGAIGAAIATMIGYLTSFIARTYIMHSIIKMKTDWGKHNICYSLLLFQSFLSLSENNVIFELIVLISMTYIYRKFFKEIIKKFNKKLFVN